MLTPREMVLRLNGGGGLKPLGPVEVPVFVLVVPPVPPVPPVDPGVAEVLLLGDTSGEKTPPSAYSDRFKP